MMKLIIIKHMISQNLESSKEKQSESKNEPLFVYDGKTYYGNREKVYKNIHVLKESYDILDIDDNDLVVLNPIVKVPEYIINLYIESCHADHPQISRKRGSYTEEERKKINSKSCLNGVLNIGEKIQPCDFIPFLKFIDQYPTVNLSIDTMEIDICFYVNENMTFVDADSFEYLGKITDKYNLKYMYLNIHNYKLKMKNYLNGIHDDDEKIEPDYVVSFIKYIELYPIETISINALENVLCKYIDEYKIFDNGEHFEYFKKITDKYRLVAMENAIHKYEKNIT